MEKIIYFIFISIFFMQNVGYTIEKNEIAKRKELENLEKILLKSKVRINKGSSYTWKDFMKFLPTISVSRNSPYGDAMAEDTETYLSASISFNQLYDIVDIADKYDKMKQTAIRKIKSLGYKIEKMVERKYLLLDQMWKMEQIIKSLEEPLEMAAMQEKLNLLQLKINETLIDIESLYAELEYICVEVEN